ncbi:MAG: L,D-transpeptidase [Anaerolineae bacterium]
MRRILRLLWRSLAVLLLAAMSVSCYEAVSLLTPKRSVADVLAHNPAPGEVIEVDAYFSGAALPPSAVEGEPKPAATSEAVPDPRAILTDRPFVPELSFLGERVANVLPADAAYLVVTPGPGAPPLAQLPYYARFRGTLNTLPPAAPSQRAVRILTLERVVRVHAQEPPAPKPATPPSAWSRYRHPTAGYTIPLPPGWRADEGEDGAVTLSTRQWPDSPITIRIHPGETHHDPYDPDAAPPLLRGVDWNAFTQGVEATGMPLYGYRIDEGRAPGPLRTMILFSAHGSTFELGLRYPLGLAASQGVLSAFTAVVGGFRFEAPPLPSPTPPVRQELGPGPFLAEQDILDTACKLMQRDIDSLDARLLSEADARRLAGTCATFTGHREGVWLLGLRTQGSRTHGLRLFLDATTGDELCREEVDPNSLPEPRPINIAEPTADGRPPEAARGERWIEVSLGQQMVYAWEGETVVRRMYASTGTAQHPTVTGWFRIYLKMPVTTMTGPGYSIPHVPHVMYFHEGYALHGAYWHFSFGTPMSHGCVNLSLADAAWLFDWTSPPMPADTYSITATVCNPGTLVIVHQ